MTDAPSDARLEDLPLFPLPGLVLLPDEILPLHVFEPRYRALIADVAEADGVLGIATVRPGFEDAELERPPLFPEIGLGRIVRAVQLPDGRSNILVASVGVGLLEDEHTTDTPYRRVRVRRHEVRGAAHAGPSEALRLLALQVAATVGPLGPRERLFALDGAAWVHAMARLFLRDADTRRAFLQASSIAARTALVEEALVGWLAEAGGVDEA